MAKVGKQARLDISKWDLSDRGFKELDVWKFNYPCQDDRQLAIDKTVSAFDRMRLSREDKLWQMLLPKEERGKGKILSNLNLHQGPIQRSSTPSINVQATDDAGIGEHTVNGEHTTGNDSDGRKDRLAPSDAEPMVRSKSQDQTKKTKISAKEAQSKRLLSKNPKKSTPAPKPKVKETKEANSGVKKTGKKAGVAASSTIKSTEFVHDSDEDEVMEDAVSLSAKSTAQADDKPIKPLPKPISSRKPDVPEKPIPVETKDIKIQKTTPPPAKAPEIPSNSSSSGSKHRLSDSSQSSVPMTKSLSRQRTTSSPHKPSPLGSSPPTNASDFDNGSGSMHASSTSSTPLISQVRNRITTPNTDAGAARPSQGTPQNTSEQSLKRKHDDVDSEIHSHNIPPTNGRMNGLTNGLTNGYTSSAKRPKASPISPPTSESSNSSISPPIHSETLRKAERFKTFYAKYEKLYQEVSAWPDAPKEKIESVMKMHQRLVAMKDEFRKGT